MNDKELIRACLLEISRRSGYTDLASLRQRDLEHLSAEIEERTGILISISTIKRLLNGQFNLLPQAATLNAITAYLGYQNWQEFRRSKQQEFSPQERNTAPAGSPSKNKSRHVLYRVGIAGVIVILFVAIVSLTRSSKHDAINEKDVSFSMKRTTTNDIPNTVVFTYDIDKVKGDSFFIQQSWDRDRRVRIEKNRHTLTDIYYEPGYHNARLIVNDKIVKTIDVSIPTNDWFFFNKPGLFKGLPAYIHPAAPVHNGMLSLTREDVINSRIDPQQENFYYYTLFPENCDAGSDDFSLEMRIRVKAINNVACPIIIPEVCGQTNSIYFFTTLPGCTGNIAVNVSEQLLSGKTNDLSGFGCDIRQWQDIRLTVKNKEARFYINQREVFKQSYSTSPGLITGLAFMSNGLCEIDHISLKGLDGKVFYENEFDAQIP